jgi:hypothetical protein
VGGLSEEQQNSLKIQSNRGGGKRKLNGRYEDRRLRKTLDTQVNGGSHISCRCLVEIIRKRRRAVVEIDGGEEASMAARLVCGCIGLLGCRREK